MVGLAFLQVILRSFFSAGILWADVFLRHLVLWVGFLGAAVGVEENGHFAIDVLKKSLPETARGPAEWLTDLFSAAVLVFLSHAAWKFFEDDRASGSVLFTLGNIGIPSWWMNAIVPIAFVLLFLHFALRLFGRALEKTSS